MRRVLLLAVLLAGCATPTGPWTVTGVGPEDEATARQLVAAAVRVTGDRQGWIGAGGVLRFAATVPGNCGLEEPWIATGCGTLGQVDVAWPHPTAGYVMERTALPHEFCYLGLQHGANLWGSAREVTEAEADACALLVVQEWRKGLP